MRLEINFRLTVSTNGKSTRLRHKWKDFCIYWLRFRCGWLWLAEKFLQKRRWFSILIVTIHLLDKLTRAIAAKQQNCLFLVFEGNIQNMEAAFALFTVVETRRFIGWDTNKLFISTCWTINISNSLPHFLVHTHFFPSLFAWLNRDIVEQLFVG